MSWARIFARLKRLVDERRPRETVGVEGALLDTARALTPVVPVCIECRLAMDGEPGWMHANCKRLLDLAHTDAGIRA